MSEQIELHENKLANPAQYVDEWGSYTQQHQQGLLRHWQKEIANFSDQLQILNAIQ